ncbi:MULTISPECIES: pyridoxal kinase PdxY [unclassified Bosea (in: a-proteobacteria)]|uniref:pyridoxal kinase PdxY n=1 Tax=unclassified Bosea (in: a-proteobacteria) TaxID=2653178 RepID=UPI000F7592F6|nr:MULTISPECIES: pyridoxal kinase PdxY [unclassified Bosea (in: a-proteobacteria)]AZO76497.1 pyridoxal kinase [Bosea sp. Tri-49]RXT26423.1 pyridoxal kinase [Bosea sp. Tri-39]RXT31664.1 pyridoxal kinase [Bosea sp. Tri-54]
MNILSIQSHVAYGHVGNASAVFPMQRLGVEVWPIHTVQFSNHTGYGAWKGQVFDGATIDELMAGIGERGVLGRCDGVLSGYMGSADIGHAILSAVAKVREANPKTMYCCDPVIGDVGRGVFVRPGIPEFMREQAVPAADIVTPNQFELELLTDVEVRTLADAHRAVEALRDAGPKVVLVTSLITNETPADSIDLMAADVQGIYRVRTPKIDININGAGDAIAALFFVHYLRDGSAASALGKAASSIYGLLKRTKEAGSREILTVAAQDEFVTPSQLFTAEAV